MILINYKAGLLAAILSLSLPAIAQTERQITDFTKAAKFDDISEVKELLAEGVNPNAVDPKGNH